MVTRVDKIKFITVLASAFAVGVDNLMKGVHLARDVIKI